MTVDLDQINMSELINNNSWDVNKMVLLFGINYDPNINNLGSIGNLDNNFWVWGPNTRCHRLNTIVYHHLNYNLTKFESWKCWKKIWKMNVTPRVKHFIWMVFQGKLPTTDYLYKLNLGPDNPCILCGLTKESIDHLFNQCPKTQLVWRHLSIKVLLWLLAFLSFLFKVYYLSYFCKGLVHLELVVMRFSKTFNLTTMPSFAEPLLMPMSLPCKIRIYSVEN